MRHNTHLRFEHIMAKVLGRWIAHAVYSVRPCYTFLGRRHTMRPSCVRTVDWA